jgi:Glyceraldehyde-3-phosphate dehydrogenase/erythrose-4-phosphate dehydrogenase
LLEGTGYLQKEKTLRDTFLQEQKKVLISAPASGEDLTVVFWS